MEGIQNVREDMDVVGSDDQPVGVVDKVEGDQIKLTKRDSGDGAHHFIPASWVDTCDGDTVRLNRSADDAMAEWGGGDGNEEMDAAAGGL